MRRLVLVLALLFVLPAQAQIVYDGATGPVLEAKDGDLCKLFTVNGAAGPVTLVAKFSSQLEVASNALMLGKMVHAAWAKSINGVSYPYYMSCPTLGPMAGVAPPSGSTLFTEYQIINSIEALP